MPRSSSGASKCRSSGSAAYAPPVFHRTKGDFRIDDCIPQIQAIKSGKITFHALSSGNYPGTPIDAKALPGLNSIGFWDAVGRQDWGLNTHRNEGLEIVFLETGSCAFTVDGKWHRIQAGDFTLTRPWELHSLGDPNLGPGRLHWLIIDVGVRRPNQPWIWPKWVMLQPDTLKEFSERLRSNQQPVWRASPQIVAAFKGLARTIQDETDRHKNSRMAIQLNTLLLAIADVLGEQLVHEGAGSNRCQQTVKVFLGDLEQQVRSASIEWTLERMAKTCGMGITAFSKYCRELVNASPMDYLNRCRLEHAARLLRAAPERDIISIAMETGYNSSQYFATSFRSRFGCTPSVYRHRRG